MHESRFENHTIAIEVAQPDAAEAIVRIQKETWLATYPNEEHGITVEDILAKGLGSSERMERWRKNIAEQAEKDRTWVAKEDGLVIGYCFAKKGETEHEIGALYVLPSHQGKQIGQKLVSEALAWLGNDKPTVLGVASYNTKAIAFYKRMGFKESAEPPAGIAALPSGKYIPQLKMVRAV